MSAEAAVAREIQEELNIYVDIATLRYISSGSRFYPYQ